MTSTVSQNEVRLKFSKVMSEMYREEVPLYDKLVGLNRRINEQVVERDGLSADILGDIESEYHGAIRVGTPVELCFIRDVFNQMGMHPVSYYDLGVAGIPAHSTAFRPVGEENIKDAPFRMFTSLARIDEINDEDMRALLHKTLDKRDIKPNGIVDLMAVAEEQGGLKDEQAHDFVELAAEIFSWDCNALVSKEDYDRIAENHKIFADIVCFKGPHINHLTPRSLDIDLMQAAMEADGDIKAKARIEGPPRRDVPILLRQTSFMALEEDVTFACGTKGFHRARFGEIEQRGYALTREGMDLYDRLNGELNQDVSGADEEEYSARQEALFKDFPDNLPELKQSGLIRLDDKGVPIVYQDFLPVSAAGIFKSNAVDGRADVCAQQGNEELFSRQLSCKPFSPYEI